MQDQPSEELKNGYLFRDKTGLFFIRMLDTVIHMLFKLRKKRSLPKEIRKILLVKPDHLGDMLMMTAVLPLIRKKYPAAEIDIVCQTQSEIILQGNPVVHRTIPVDHFRISRNPLSPLKKIFLFISQCRKFLKNARNDLYDVCVLMRAYGWNLALIAYLSRSRHIIGFSTGGCGGLMDEVIPWRPGIHELEHFLDLLRPIGIEASVPDLSYQIYPTLPDQNAVDAKLKGAGAGGKKIAFVHPGAGDLRKSLEENLWKEAVLLLEKKGYQVVLTGSENERALLKKIASKDSLLFAGDFTVLQLACLYTRGDILITVDTLAAHLGGWSGIKTVVFYCGINQSKHWKPVGKNVIIMERQLPCVPCHNSCDGRECMQFSIEDFKKII